MTAIDEAKTALTKLSIAERRTLLEWLATEPSNCLRAFTALRGSLVGDACVGNTRIPLWLLESHRRAGLSDVDLRKAYPSLKQTDLTNAWAFARAHSDEMTRLIRENESSAMSFRTR